MAITVPGLNLSILRQDTVVQSGRPLLISGRFTALGIGLPAFIRVTLEGPSYDPQLRTFATFASPFSGDYSVNVLAEKDGQFFVFAEAFPPPLLPAGPLFPDPLLLPPAFAESTRPPLAVGGLVEGGVDALLPDGTRRFLPTPPMQPIEFAPMITVAAPVSVTLPGAPAGGGLFPFLPPAVTPAPVAVPGVPLPVGPVSAAIDDITFTPDSVEPGQEAIGRMAWHNSGEADQQFHIVIFLVDRFGAWFGPLQVNQMVAAPPQVPMTLNLRLSTLGLLPGVYGVAVELYDPATGQGVGSQLVAQRLAVQEFAPVEEVGVPALPPAPELPLLDMPVAEAPLLPTADMLLLPMLDAPPSVELGQAWQGIVEVGTTWPAALPLPATLPSYPLNAVIELESPAGLLSVIQQAQPRFIPGQTMTIPFNLATGSLPEAGSYQVLALISDLQGNPLFSGVIGFLQLLPMPTPEEVLAAAEELIPPLPEAPALPAPDEVIPPLPEAPVPEAPEVPLPIPEAPVLSQFESIQVMLGLSEVGAGDVLTVPVVYTHQGAPETVTLHAAIGNHGAFGFDEILFARKTVNVPPDPLATEHRDAIDIPITTRLLAGREYSVYAKLIRSFPFGEVISRVKVEHVILPGEALPPLVLPSQFSDVTVLMGATTVLPGESVEIPVWVVHQGGADLKRVYAAIGTKGIFFNEHTAASRLVNFRQDDQPNSYIENVAVPIPAGMTPGTYDVYAKVLQTAPLQISPVVRGVIEVRAAAEQFTLTVRQEPLVGQVTVNPQKAAYNRLDVVTLTAQLFVPENREWEFDHWEINGSRRTTNPASVIMTADSEAVVFYRSKPVTAATEPVAEAPEGPTEEEVPPPVVSEGEGRMTGA